MFKKKDFKKFKNQGNVVFKSGLLETLSPFERYELLQLCHRRKYKEGETIYYQNDPGAGMYFIEEGAVRLVMTGPEDKPDTTQLSVDLKAPSEFGIIAIGYEIPRMTTAICLEESILLGFFNPDYESLKKRHPETAIKLLEAISKRILQQFDQSIQTLRDDDKLESAFSILFQQESDKTLAT